MPRDSAGNYTLPTGNPVISGTTITTAWANPTLQDIGAELANSLDRSGRGGMLAPFKFADGTLGNPGITWGNEPTSGIRRAATNDMQAVIAGVQRMRWTASTVDLWDTLSSTWISLVSPTGANFVPGVANRSATIGLTVKQGTALTAARSDSAPALDQAIVPTWTNTHTYIKSATTALDGALLLQSALPLIGFVQTGATSTNKTWALLASAEQFIGTAHTDAGGSGVNWLTVDRTGTTIDSIALSATNVTMSNHIVVNGGVYARGGTVRLASDLVALTDLADGYLRLNDSNHYANGVYTRSAMRAAGPLRSDIQFTNADGSKHLTWNTGALSYGTAYITGTVNGFHGIAVYDGTLNPTLMSSSTSAGIFVPGDSKWLFYRSSGSLANCDYTLHASAFDSNSSRTLKRETGTPVNAHQILAKLRPILYRLLADDEHEQVGLIAEEVHEICPWLSRDGKSVAYDRVPLLILSALQQMGFFTLHVPYEVPHG